MVIVFVPHLTDGGAERVLSELITYWHKAGVKIVLAEVEPKMFDNSYPMPDGIEIIKAKTYTNPLMRYAGIIRFMIRTMRRYPDATVIAFSKLVLLKLALAMPFVSNKIVLSERNDPYTLPTQKYKRIIRDWAFKKADACVFQTPGAMGYFPDKVQKKGVIIPNPINPMMPDPYEGPRENTIVAAGRLAPQKNFPMLIDAFALVHAKLPEYRLIIYGRGELEQSLRQKARDLGLEGCVDFPGFSDNLYEDIKKSALYASSSDFEGISNSMLEALALGLPSVVTDCPAGGARMVIRDHENGILVPVGDASAMGKAMIEVLSDPTLSQKLHREAQRVRDEYPIEKVAKRWMELF